MNVTERKVLLHKLEWLEERRQNTERLLSRLDRQIADLRDQIPQVFVQVAYLSRYDTDLRNKRPYDFIDGTTNGLKVGDRLQLPSPYGLTPPGVVIALGASGIWNGPWATLTDADVVS